MVGFVDDPCVRNSQYKRGANIRTEKEGYAVVTKNWGMQERSVKIQIKWDTME